MSSLELSLDHQSSHGRCQGSTNPKQASNEVCYMDCARNSATTPSWFPMPPSFGLRSHILIAHRRVQALGVQTCVKFTCLLSVIDTTTCVLCWIKLEIQVDFDKLFLALAWVPGDLGSDGDLSSCSAHGGAAEFFFLISFGACNGMQGLTMFYAVRCC